MAGQLHDEVGAHLLALRLSLARLQARLTAPIPNPAAPATSQGCLTQELPIRPTASRSPRRHAPHQSRHLATSPRTRPTHRPAHPNRATTRPMRPPLPFRRQRPGTVTGRRSLPKPVFDLAGSAAIYHQTCQGQRRQCAACL